MTQRNPTGPTGENGRLKGDGGPHLGQGSGLAEQAKQTAGTIKSEAKDELTSRVSERKNQAAEGLGSIARALQSSRNEIADEAIADYANRAADGVERLARYIQTRTVGELVGNVASFARREPALFYGGSLVLGVLAGRLLRSGPSMLGEGSETPSGASSSGGGERFGYSSESTYEGGSGVGGSMSGAVYGSPPSESSFVPPKPAYTPPSSTPIGGTSAGVSTPTEWPPITSGEKKS